MLYARQWCNAPEDALQEALIDLARLDPAPANPAAWLFTTVRRKAINLSRSENRRQKHQQQASEDKPAWFELDPGAGIQSEELEIYLQQLDPLDREIVVTRIWGELTFEQIAELVDRPLSVVYRHYRQSLTFLGQQIDGTPKPDSGKRSTH